MTKLEGFLNLCVLWLAEAVKKVEPGDDLPPLLIAVAEQGTFVLQMPERGDHLREWATDKLLDIGATHYATFTAVWLTWGVYGPSLPTTVPKEEEGYVASVGDRNGSIIAMFSVQRDEAGKIIRLFRQPVPANSLVGGELSDLLTELRH